MKNAFFFIALLLTTRLSAQSLALSERIPGQILLLLAEPNANIERVLADLNAQQAANAHLRVEKNLQTPWNLHLLAFDETILSPQTILALVRKHPAVRIAQFNHRARERAEPNDSLWYRQADMLQIGADQVWDLSTGGLTPQGDTIVLAVIEQWAHRTHPDIQPNLWVNWAETPENGLDDDANGYVDDRLGFNAALGVGDDDGFLMAKALNANLLHSPGVTAIAGARGNNGLGITGVNWQVKLLNIAAPGLEEPTILAAYIYVCEQRKRYNQSGGQQGAFIVASNSSFGIDDAKPEDYPLWCALYDSLGAAGVLNCVATANHDTDVDAFGDMPSACPSEFVISVNNVNQTDERQPSGFGAESIDLAAPGSGTFTAALGSAYATLGGCSAATPHVSGSLALLYSLGCEALASDAKTNPPACARRMRDLLLNHVFPLPELEGRCVTGGRLDVAAAARAAVDNCDAGPLPEKNFWFAPNPAHDFLDIHYRTAGLEKMPIRVFDAQGRLVFSAVLPPHPFGEKAERVKTATWGAGLYFLVSGAGAAERFVKI